MCKYSIGASPFAYRLEGKVLMMSNETVDIEDSLTQSAIQAEIIAGVVSMLWNTLAEVKEARDCAKSKKEMFQAHYNVLNAVSTLLPVLEMLMDYTRDNKIHVRQVCDCYEESKFQ